MYRIVIITLLLTLKLNATTQSVQSGKWGSTSTWSNGQVPNASDSVVILKNHKISLSQASNECMHLIVKGNVFCSSSSKVLTCGTLMLMDSSSLSSNVLGTIVVDTLNAVGNSAVEGFNLKVNALFQVRNGITFHRTSGLVEIKNLLIDLDATWSVPDNQSFTITGWLENNGKLSSGKGKYTFVGNNILKGSKDILINNFCFTDTLVNQGRLEISESILAPETAILINQSSGTLVLKMTDSQFKVKQLDLKSLGNTLIMARGTRQRLPPSTNLEYQQLFISGGGELLADFEIKIKQQLLIDSLSMLTVGNRITANNKAIFTMKKEAVLKFNSDVSNDFNNFVKGFNFSEIDSLSSIIISTDVGFVLPVFDYPNLELKSGTSINVLSEGNQVFRADLRLGMNVTMDVGGQRIVINGNVEGSGKLLALNGSVNYQGTAAQKILPSEYDTLIINNPSLDTSSALGNFNVNVFHVQRGKVKVGSLTIKELSIENSSEVLVGSVNLEISAVLLNKGQFTVTSNTANCVFKGSLFNIGSFENNSSSNHILFANVINNGEFQGCLGTGCTWEINGNINVSGSSTLYFPRIKFAGSDTVFNKGNVSVSMSIKGQGKFINLSNSILTLGMNGDQNDASVNAWEYSGNTVIFNKSGDQNIHGVDFNIVQNLVLSKPGHKRMLQNIEVQGDLTVDTNSTFNVGSNDLKVQGGSVLYLKPKSAMVLGSSSNPNPTTFPVAFKNGNLFLHKTSTISYESQGNQTISTVPNYGNLHIKDGAVTQSVKTVGVGDSLLVGGDFLITESSIDLIAGDKVLVVQGNWEGPGNIKFGFGAFVLHGHANSTGELSLGLTPVHYVGDGDQHMKNAEYYNLFVNKPSGTATIDAGKGVFLVKNNMYLNNGKVQVGGEKFEIQESLVISDTLIFKSRVQEKILNHVQVNPKAFFDNSYGVKLQIKGNVTALGNWTNGKKSIVYFNSENSQIIKSGQLVEFDKVIFRKGQGNKVMNLKGNFKVNDSLILDNASIIFDSALVYLSLNATLYGESEQNQLTGKESVIIAQINLKSTLHENIAGLGYSVYSDTAFGEGRLTRGFDPVVLFNGELSINKSYLLELSDSSRHLYQTSISYFSYELSNHDESILTVYYNYNYLNTFRLGLSTLHNQFNKVAYSGVETGSKITLGELDGDPLPVQLISFNATLNTSNTSKIVTLAWKVGSEINTQKYLLYVSEDGVNYSLLTEVNWKKSNHDGNEYSYDYTLKMNSSILYYKLYEQDLFGEIDYLDVDTLNTVDAVSVVIINEQEVNFPRFSQKATFSLYDMSGKKIMSSMVPNFNAVSTQQICLLCVEEFKQNSCKKIYLK
ncbi:MAG: hypothetical protein ACJA0Q_000282 [Saprospiraceae bacterium]|jgi:hypothetical protein